MKKTLTESEYAEAIKLWERTYEPNISNDESLDCLDQIQAMFYANPKRKLQELRAGRVNPNASTQPSCDTCLDMGVPCKCVNEGERQASSDQWAILPDGSPTAREDVTDEEWEELLQRDVFIIGEGVPSYQTAGILKEMKLDNATVLHLMDLIHPMEAEEQCQCCLKLWKGVFLWNGKPICGECLEFKEAE